jgi:hypothetical protein
MYWFMRSFLPAPSYAPFGFLRYIGTFMLVPALWGALKA